MSVMKHRLIILLLFTGVLHLVMSLSRKYILIQQQKTWSDAQAYCRNQYIDLAIINTNDEMTELQNAAQRKQFSSKAWIGLFTNVHSWHWSINNEPLGSFTAWDKPSEPNNFWSDELCVILVGSVWHDAPCNWLQTFICFDDRTGATEKYVLIQQYKSWSDAQSYCRQHHTDLASARDATENSDLVAKNVGCSWSWSWSWYQYSHCRSWFGLRRDPWKWTDQTTDVSIIRWLGGDINDYVQNKSCGYLDGAIADSEQCSITMPFFCNLFPVQQQIIRLKLISSEDVNDPAVISAINEKLKQKLKEHGITGNITVTWRKQPDGEVFHKEEENITTGTNATEECDSVYFVKP